MSKKPKKNITVVGAGISGLSVATLLQAEHQVTLVASHFPDEQTYVSPLTVWRSDAANPQQQAFDSETFKNFWNLALKRSSETGITTIDSLEYWDELPVEPWFKDLCPNYRRLEEGELPAGVKFGISYRTVRIPPKYHSHLLAQFRLIGGTTRKQSLSDIQDANFENPDTVINCTGFGSKTLVGVQDSQVYLVRRQVAVVQLPPGHINYTFIRHSSEKIVKGDHELLTYVIPGDDGEVIFGGTLSRNDYSTDCNKEIADDIIERCLVTCPDLLPKGETHLTIKRNDVSFHAARNGGVRIETQGIQKPGDLKKEGILLLHNYGYGEYESQSSYGAAQHVFQMLEPHLKNNQ